MYADLTKDERLLAVHRDFCKASDFYRERNAERERAFKFHHNTKGCGQYEHDELEYLKKRRRPALTWNIGAGYVRKAVGLSQANALEPRVVAMGGEDKLTVEVVQRLFEALRSTLNHDALDSEADEARHIAGESGLHLDARRDPKRPSDVRVEAKVIDARELYWDPESRSRDRSDARYLFWPRWLTKAEFVRDYPEHAADWEQFVSNAGGKSDGPALPEHLEELLDDGRRGDYDKLFGGEFYDPSTKRARLLHCEYVRPVKRTYLVNEATGEFREVTPGAAKAATRMQEAGYEEFMGLEVVEVQDTEVAWLETCANTVLFDDASPEPYDGFSVVPLVLAIDAADGATYGMWRNYFDPQRETNKRHSSLLEMLALQAHPGTDAEEDAITDEHQFEEATAGNTAVRYVKPGKIASVRDRPPPDIPAGTLAALQESKALFEQIGVAGGGIDTPAGAAEAAFTVQLRQEWTKLDLLLFFDTYKAYQKGVAQRELQIILRAMPDHQIERMLSNPERYKVQDGVVLVLGEPQAQGQEPQLEGKVSLETLRGSQYDIDFDVASRNPGMRAASHQTFLGMQSVGIPVDPEIMYDSATSSTADAERLKAYAKGVARAQAASQDADAQQLQQLTQVQAQLEQQRIQIDALKAAEVQRHNMATELQLKVKTVMDADANEQAAAMEILGLVTELLAAPVVVPAKGNGASRGMSSAA